MRSPEETARRWLAQAEHSLHTTRVLLDNALWSQACFHAEQTAQLALKAFLYSKGRRFINIRSIRSLTMECGAEDTEFLQFENYGLVLDRYYLATRYPDVLPQPAIPFEAFTQQDATQALEYASEIVNLVKNKVESGV